MSHTTLPPSGLVPVRVMKPIGGGNGGRAAGGKNVHALVAAGARVARVAPDATDGGLRLAPHREAQRGRALNAQRVAPVAQQLGLHPQQVAGGCLSPRS